MTETFLTVISGVLVFVLCQMFNEYCLKPIQKYNELRAKIAYSLTIYAYLYMNPVLYSEEFGLYDRGEQEEEINKASYECRKLAAEVDAMIELRPFGNICIARKEILAEVSEKLIDISNNFYSSVPELATATNKKARNNIYKLLKLKSREEKMIQ